MRSLSQTTAIKGVFRTPQMHTVVCVCVWPCSFPLRWVNDAYPLLSRSTFIWYISQISDNWDSPWFNKIDFSLARIFSPSLVALTISIECLMVPIKGICSTTPKHSPVDTSPYFTTHHFLICPVDSWTKNSPYVYPLHAILHRMCNADICLPHILECIQHFSVLSESLWFCFDPLSFMLKARANPAQSQVTITRLMFKEQHSISPISMIPLKYYNPIGFIANQSNGHFKHMLAKETILLACSFFYYIRCPRSFIGDPIW